MPAWVVSILSWLGKILAPLVKDFFEKLKKKNKIEREEDAKREALENILEQAQNWMRDNPGEPLPKDLEDKLRDYADRTNSL